MITITIDQKYSTQEEKDIFHTLLKFGEFSLLDNEARRVAKENNIDVTVLLLNNPPLVAIEKKERMCQASVMDILNSAGIEYKVFHSGSEIMFSTYLGNYHLFLGNEDQGYRLSILKDDNKNSGQELFWTHLELNITDREFILEFYRDSNLLISVIINKKSVSK